MGECLIIRRSSESYSLPVLNDNYPLDQSIGFVSGTEATANFEIKISTAGSPASYTYQWYLNGSAISGATGASYVWSGSTAGTHKLYCTVTNKAGTVTSRIATLIVAESYPPILNASYPANQTVEYGGSASFNVSISTQGVPNSYTYQWYKNGIAIDGATNSSYTASGWSSGSYELFCIVANSAGSVQSRTATYKVGSNSPEDGVDFTYTGEYSYDKGSSGNWKLKLLSSGILTFYNRGSGKDGMDVFVVGGGAGGGPHTRLGCGGGGGGGGYTATKKGVAVDIKTGYSIIVGDGGSYNTRGGTSSAVFGNTTISAAGGYPGENVTFTSPGGNGGSGGGQGGVDVSGQGEYRARAAGGSNGGNGSGDEGGTGQGSTTYEFGESSSGIMYGGGGAGGTGGNVWGYGKQSALSAQTAAQGGGGASGGNAIANTGGGGGGRNCLGGSNGSCSDQATAGACQGGSGIVIIRNKRGT